MRVHQRGQQEGEDVLEGASSDCTLFPQGMVSPRTGALLMPLSPGVSWWPGDPVFCGCLGPPLPRPLPRTYTLTGRLPRVTGQSGNVRVTAFSHCPTIKGSSYCRAL